MKIILEKKVIYTTKLYESRYLVWEVFLHYRNTEAIQEVEKYFRHLKTFKNVKNHIKF